MRISIIIIAQLSPEIVTIRKSLPAPSSRLSHIWWETSLWSFDKSIELLKSILKRQYWRIPCISWATSSSPSHEIIFGPLVLVPHSDVKVLALVFVEVQLELLLPLGVQSLVHSLGLVSLSTESVISSSSSIQWPSSCLTWTCSRGHWSPPRPWLASPDPRPGAQSPRRSIPPCPASWRPALGSWHVTIVTSWGS